MQNLDRMFSRGCNFVSMSCFQSNINLFLKVAEKFHIHMQADLVHFSVAAIAARIRLYAWINFHWYFLKLHHIFLGNLVVVLLLETPEIFLKQGLGTRQMVMMLLLEKMVLQFRLSCFYIDVRILVIASLNNFFFRQIR